MRIPFNFEIKKVPAFIKRDFIEEASYKFSFLSNIFSIFLNLLTFFFLAKLFGSTVNPYLAQYGGNYFSFVLLGIAFFGYMTTSLYGLGSAIQRSQTTGTLEALLTTRTSISTIVVSSTLYNYIWTSISVLIYLALGIFLFKINIFLAGIFPALLVLVLSIVSFSCIGILSAAFLLIFKKGDPITGLFVSVSFLFGGVYYPITIFPSWLKKLAFLIPLTHSLEGMRLPLLKGCTLYDIRLNVLFLFLFSAVMLPISIFVFKYAIRKAKIEGSLTKY